MENIKKLRIWHIPQIPGEPFVIDVDSLQEAEKILSILAAYDQFQFQQKIKPDFCNAQGLNVFDDNADGMNNPGWVEYYDDEGSDLQDLVKTKKLKDSFKTISNLNKIKF